MSQKRKRKKTAESLNDRAAMAAGRRHLYIATAAIVLAVALCYGNSLANGFVFDDKAIVLGNPRLRNFENLPSLLFASYRPLRDVSHAVDFALWGESPWGFHLTNVLIHLGNALLVFWLVRRLTSDILTAIPAGLIFAVHPIQTDAVTYISGRRDVLFALFYLGSFLCYLSYRHYQKSRKWRSLTYFSVFLILWGLSLLSKEMAVSLPLLIFVWSFCDEWGKASGAWWKQSLKAAISAVRRDKWLYIILALAAVSYGWYMIFVRGGSTLVRSGGFLYWGGSFFSNVLTVLCVHAWYLKQLVWPTPVVQYLGAFEVATTIANWRVILSIIVVGSVLFTGFVLLKRDKLASFAVFSYFVFLLPVSQIIPHHELLADHYLYLPMLSFGLLVGLAVRRIASMGTLYQKAAYGSVSLALIILAAMTIMRNRDWKDEFTLWQANFREAPNSIRAAGNLANLYRTKNPNRAIELYKRCLELDPTYPGTYLGLASLMQTKDEAQKVEALILNALAMPKPETITPSQQYYRSSRSQLTTALALTKHNQGNRDEAEELLRAAIAMDPGFAEAYRILADLYRETDAEKEIEVFKKQTEANPINLQALDDVSRRLILGNRFDEALPYLERMIAIDPNNFSANCHLGQIYQKRNDCGKAREYFLTARAAATRPEQSVAIDDLDAGWNRQCGRQ